MLRHFFDTPGDQFASTPNNKKKKIQKPVSLNGLESLEERKLLSATLDWATDFTSSDANAFNGAQATFVNADGDVLVAGSFGGTVDFDPSAAVEALSVAGSRDGYVATYSSTGELDNVIQLSSTGAGYVNVRGVAQDADGNTYVAGFYSSGLELTALGNDDLVGSSSFLMQLDTDNQIAWVHEFDVSVNELMVTGTAGNAVIHLLGTYEESINFDTDESGDNILTDGDGVGAFYATFNAAGEDTYALGMSGDGNQDFNALAVSDTAIYIVGGAGDFNEGGSDVTLSTGLDNTVDEAITFEGEGNVNGFIIKLNTNGTFNDSVQIASTDSARLNDIALDANENLYIAGQYGGTADLDPSIAEDLIENPSESTNGLYLSLESDLTYRFGVAVNGSEGETNTVAIVENDEMQNVVFGGYYAGEVDFDPTVGVTNRTAVEGGDGYLIKILTDGTFLDVFTFGGAGFQNASNLAVNTDGSKLIVVGSLGSNATDLDPGAEVFVAANATAGSAFAAQLPSNYVSVNSDYSVAVSTVTLPAAIVTGSETRGSVRVMITNDTNEAPAASDRADIFVYARPIGAADASDDILVGSSLNQNLNIGLTKSRTYNVRVTLPDNLDADEYGLVTVVSQTIEEDEVFVGQTTAVGTVTVADPFVNLTASIDESRLPAATVSGDGTRIIVPVTVTNTGNVALERGQTISISLHASDANDESADLIDLEILEDISVSNLAAGASRTFRAIVTLPAGVDSSDYQILAVVDSGNDVEESNENDNEAVTEATIDVSIGEVNLNATIDDSRIQAALISGNGNSIRLPITITNDGNISLERGQRIDVTIVARPADAVNSDDDVVLSVLADQNVSNLSAGQSRRINATVELPAGLESDDYVLVAIVDSGNDVDESDEDDNEAVTDASIEVTIGQVNLIAQIDETRIPAAAIAGEVTRLIVPVTIINDGNVALERNQQADITIVARPADAVDDEDDVILTVVSDYNVGNLRAGQSRRLNVVVGLPADLDADDYVIVAIVDSGNDVDESDEDDNEAVGETTITVAEPFVNLTASIDESRLPETTVSGDGTRIIVPVTVTNSGNIALERGQTISISLHASDANDESADLIDLEILEDVSVSGLAAGASRTFRAIVTLPAGVDSSDYEILAVVDIDNDVDESDENDNEAVTESTIEVTIGQANLIAEIDDSGLDEALISGDGNRIRLPITITNDGNISIERSQLIDVTIVARPADAEDDEDDVVLTVLADQNVGNLRPGQSRRINAIVELPAGLESDDYVLVAIVDSGNDLDESDEDDNEAVTDASIEVTQGVRDLSVELDDSRLPEAAVTGSNTRFILPVTITNEGNLSLARGQQIQITVEAVRAFIPGGVGIDIPEETITVLTFDNANVSNLRPGQSRVVNLAFTLPLDDAFEDGEDYSFRVTIDTGDAIDESDEDNNEAETEAVVTVTRGGPNLTVDIDETDLPTEAISGDGTTIMVPVTVTNEGLTRLAAGQTVDIDIFIADVAEEEEPVLLTTLENQSVSLLRVGQTKTFIASVTLPGTLASDSYRLVAIVDPENLIVETDSEDNTDLSTGTLDVTQGSRDLSVDITEEDLGDFLVETNGTATITVTLTNEGNLSTAVDATTQIAVFARPVDAEDDSQDVLVESINSVDIGALAPDESVEVEVADIDLSSLELGEYNLVLLVNDAGLLNSVPENSETITIGSFEVTEDSNDLSNTFDDSTAQDFVEGEFGEGNSLTTLLTNIGSTSTAEDATVDVYIYARPVGGGDDILVQTYEGVDVSDLATDAFVTHEAESIDLSDLEAGDYRLISIVDDSELDLATEGNNEAQAGSTFTVTAANHDLAATRQAHTAEDFNTGDSGVANTITVRLSNNGNTALPADTTVTVNIFAFDIIGEMLILVKENVSVDVSDLAVEDFVDTLVDDLDLSSLEASSYFLTAIVDDGALAQADDQNNEAPATSGFVVSDEV